VNAGLAAIAILTLWSPYFVLAWGRDDQEMADEILEMLAIKPALRWPKSALETVQWPCGSRRSSEADLNNVTVVAATPTDSGLPADCCDAAYMIGVYHHITDPAPTDASIFRALKPGARLLINDFPPTIWLAFFKVKGVPANRGGHGVPDDIVINEITAAGFREMMKETHPWHPGFLIRDTYCLVFSKPEDSKTAPQK
jgi:SAM-dependent methyltransferase